MKDDEFTVRPNEKSGDSQWLQTDYAKFRWQCPSYKRNDSWTCLAYGTNPADSSHQEPVRNKAFSSRYDNRIDRAQQQADDGDRDSVPDEGRYKPDGDFETGA